LVFVDEINAPLDGQLIYGAFLGPLEDGTYVRGGKIFHIKPCVWIFAGTPEKKKEMEASSGETQKRSDFISRLSIRPQTLHVPHHEDDDGRLERVYIGATLIIRHFPDVRRVSEKVLHLFHLIPVTLGIRSLERFIRTFHDVQYGVVTSNNVTGHGLIQLKELIDFDVTNWKESLDEGELVEIVSSVSSR